MSVNKNQIANQLQNRGQFAQIPNEIYKVLNLSNTARSIWIYLASEGPGWKSSYGNIARNMDLALNTVRTGIKELVDFNMVIVTAYAEGCDFELISSDQWNVSWKVVEDKPKTPIQNSTGAKSKDEQPLVQKTHKPIIKNCSTSNKTNTTILTNTPEASASGQVSDILSLKDKGSNNLHPYKVKTSNWYQHYLKSPINEEVFKSLPEEIKSSLYAKTLQLVSGVRMSNGRISDATDAKDQFVTALEAYRQKNNPYKVTSEDDFTFEF